MRLYIFPSADEVASGPGAAASLLRANGVDAIHVGEIGLATGTDASILERARAMKATVVTLDADFHGILAHSGHSSPSVIRIRDEGVKAEALLGLIEAVLRECGGAIAEGAVVSVRQGKVRLRGLPLP